MRSPCVDCCSPADDFSCRSECARLRAFQTYLNAEFGKPRIGLPQHSPHFEDQFHARLGLA